jgi:hypothetical protein
MSLPTKLVITGLGVAVLMLLAFLTPVDATSAMREALLNFPLSAQNCLFWL